MLKIKAKKDLTMKQAMNTVKKLYPNRLIYISTMTSSRPSCEFTIQIFEDLYGVRNITTACYAAETLRAAIADLKDIRI